jgi:hypothetical protein
LHYVHSPVTLSDVTGSIGPDGGHLFSAQVPLADLVTPLGAGANYEIIAKQAGGGTLPVWLHFNPTTGIFSGTIPADAAGKMTLEVIARDALGHESILRFTIDLATGKIVWNAPLSNMYADRDSALPDRSSLRAGFDIQVASAVPVGRVGLSEQLGTHGWRALQTNRLALLKSVRELRSPAH